MPFVPSKALISYNLSTWIGQYLPIDRGVALSTTISWTLMTSNCTNKLQGKHKENKMDERRFGLYIFLGAAIGGGVGTAIGALSGNIFNGVWTGVLSGMAVGWFIAAAEHEREKKQDSQESRK
jgi:hypothetical protein